MSQFFARDFTQDRWRKAALKNAYSLLGKQRFDHAAAFFLLAGSLWDAIQVLCRKSVVCRFNCHSHGINNPSFSRRLCQRLRRKRLDASFTSLFFKQYQRGLSSVTKTGVPFKPFLRH